MSRETLRAARRWSGSARLMVLLLVIGLHLQACAEDESSRNAAASADPRTQSATPGDDPEVEARAAARTETAEGSTAPRHPGERPVPSFSGRTVAGTRLAMRDLLGARVALFFFNPEMERAVPVAHAVNRIAALQPDHNFRVVGIGVGSSGTRLSRFVKEHGLDFPVIDDSDGGIGRTLRLRAPIAILGVDPEGYMTFALGSFPEDGDVTSEVEARLRDELRLPAPGTDGSGELLTYPQAPELGVVGLSSGETLETAELEGRAALVIFFLHTCPHCHHALEAIEPMLEAIPADDRPRLVAVSLQNDPRAVRRSLEELGLDYFDPYLDPGGEATDRWGVTGGVPVVLVLDPQGRIRHRSTGWDERRDPGLVRMKLAAAAGARVPMLLDPTGYSGNDVCGTCHETEYATWTFTEHSSAYDTLVKHAAERRTDCIGCHVVGYGEKGGYEYGHVDPTHLENVGCESCHGRGGPHLSPDFVPETGYAAVCETCHNETHSLGFEYETFHPRVSHTRIASLSAAERAEMRGEGGPRRDLLPTRADYVGSDACRSCHTQEFATWEASGHGHAVTTLEEKGKAGDADCLQCHTTAYGKPGGFPEGASPDDHPDLARVGCESCHGPGGDHVGPDARRVGTILSLGDKCDSCVILKICGSCHDDQNDPGFRFRVEERIEQQRHGTIEPAATRDDAAADRARIAEVIERLARRTARDGPATGSVPRAPAADPG